MNGLSRNHRSLAIHQDLKHDPFHDRVDVCVEHSNIMGVSNPANRSKGLPTPCFKKIGSLISQKA